jgi:two-component system, sensor histidine kinase and response regulator
MYQRENNKSNIPAASLTDEESNFDLSILEEMDDPEYTAEIITLFIKDTPRQLKEIREALAAGVSETISKAAHKLKSSAGVLQANKLIKLLADIETMSKTGKTGEELSGLLKNAEQEYTSLEQKLKKHLKK